MIAISGAFLLCLSLVCFLVGAVMFIADMIITNEVWFWACQIGFVSASLGSLLLAAAFLVGA